MGVDPSPVPRHSVSGHRRLLACRARADQCPRLCPALISDSYPRLGPLRFTKSIRRMILMPSKMRPIAPCPCWMPKIRLRLQYRSSVVTEPTSFVLSYHNKSSKSSQCGYNIRPCNRCGPNCGRPSRKTMSKTRLGRNKS